MYITNLTSTPISPGAQIQIIRYALRTQYLRDITSTRPSDIHHVLGAEDSARTRLDESNESKRVIGQGE